MKGGERLPIAKHPRPLGGSLAIAGTFQKPWGKFQWTDGARQAYSVMPSCLPDEEQNPRPAWYPNQLWIPQVDIRLVSWEEAGVETPLARQSDSIPTTSELGLHRGGITVGVYFHGDYGEAMEDELQAALEGTDTMNPLVESLAHNAIMHTKIGIGIWRDKMRQLEIRRGRRILGSAGLAAAGFVMGASAAVGYPAEGAFAGLCLAAGDMVGIELLQTGHEQSYDARLQSVSDQKNAYARAIERDIYGIFTAPQPRNPG